MLNEKKLLRELTIYHFMQTAVEIGSLLQTDKIQRAQIASIMFRAFKRMLIAAAYSDIVTQDKPTHYTRYEGGPWVEWNTHRDIAVYLAAYSIKFESGAIFGMVNGWRDTRGVHRKLPPLPADDHGETCLCKICYEKKFQQITPERLVPRYHTEAAVEPSAVSGHAEGKPPCSSYHSMSLNGKCQNCGNSKELHQ